MADGIAYSTEKIPPFLTAVCLVSRGASSGLDGKMEEETSARRDKTGVVYVTAHRLSGWLGITACNFKDGAWFPD